MLHMLSKDNFTVLMTVSYGGLASVVKRVLPHSVVKVTVVSTHASQGGYSALMYASMHGHSAVVEQLLRTGADKALCTTSGDNALTLASASGHKDVCSQLHSH